MGGANQYQHSSSKRVNVNICGRVPSFYRNLYRYQVSCVVVLWVIELREFNDEKKKNNMDKNAKLDIIWLKVGIYD